MDSSQTIINRKTEETTESSQHLIKERIEKTERKYFAGQRITENIQKNVISEDNEPKIVRTSTSSTKEITTIKKKNDDHEKMSSTDITTVSNFGSNQPPDNDSAVNQENSENSEENQKIRSNDPKVINDNEEENSATGGGDAVTDGGCEDVPDNAQLISRTTQQVKKEQVKTITKVYQTREIRHIGPDGQPIVVMDQQLQQQISSPPDTFENSTNEYTNFPGPKSMIINTNTNNNNNNNASPGVDGFGPPGMDPSQQENHNFVVDYNNFDPHYSNTNFQKILQQQQQQQQQQQNHQMAPSPSPGSGSTVTTGSTAAATASFANQRAYDPYSRNNQIGYQDYSNFNNYQDMAHDNGHVVGHHPPPSDRAHSPQPPIRRHHMAEMSPGGGGGGGGQDNATFVQTATMQQQPPPPTLYGYVPNSAAQQIQIPLNAVGGLPPGSMHSPGNQHHHSTGTAIYGNFEDLPQGYLDRRQTYDDNNNNNGGGIGPTYGQMIGPGPRNIPIHTTTYEDAQSACQRLLAIHQAAQTAMFFQNGTMMAGGASSTMMPGAGGPNGGGVAPGSSAVTAIGPDGVRWRDPDLHEVIEFLTHPNSIVRANAAAYLQHLCFMDDSMKAKTRALGGVQALINLLAQDVPEIQRNACGALRNLSYGRQNDENKRAIRNAAGIPALVRLLRKSPDNEIRELVTSVLWNLSSCEDLKKQIIDDALQILVASVIIPHSGWNNQQPQQHQQQQQQQSQQPIYWSTVFRNASGVLRNVSSAGLYARTRLRECEGLVDSLLFLVRAAIGKNDMDNKSVENCVCILRNLSYRCQEVIDPEYDKHPPGYTSPNNSSGNSNNNNSSTHTSTTSPPYSSLSSNTSNASATSPSSTLSPSSSSSSKNSSSSLMGGLSSKVGENISCFGGSKKKSKSHGHHNHHGDSTMSPSGSMSGLESKTAQLSLNNGQQRSGEVARGMELLWQTDVVQPYLALLSECSNPETLEAAAGAIQNLAACYWQPSIDIRGAVRKEKGLPILVELLRMEVDRVVCAVATALRNLAMDTRNKELIGKYALKDLVSKLPAPSATGIPLETGTSDDTVAAVLATLNEVISRNPDFAKSMLEAGGMQRLTLITKHRNRFSNRVVKFTSQLLYNMWQHTELRDVYRKAGWKESHFILSHSITNSTSAHHHNSQQQQRSQRSVNGPGSVSTPMMTPSQSAIMMHQTPSTPTANGTLPGSGFYHSISANNTLSRPMSTVGGTKYEDHAQYNRQGTLPRTNTNVSQAAAVAAQQQQLMAQRMHEEMLMTDMLDGTVVANGVGAGTLVRPPIGGVPIFPPGTLPGEPVYAQVNRERKRQQQQQQQQQLQQLHPSASPQPPPLPLPGNHPAVNSNHHHLQPETIPMSSKSSNNSSNGGGSGGSSSQMYHNVMIDPTNNEPIYPPSMPAGDSWV